ncbi:MAG TPA: hypothetical protein VNM22_05730 [Candidatus Limnocylindrales bacterium]|nr:hypothetical protein [Candidatus Limnocylindrales bacterium]
MAGINAVYCSLCCFNALAITVPRHIDLNGKLMSGRVSTRASKKQ